MKIIASLAFLFILSLPAAAQNLRIYHIDVEQADCTLFISPVARVPGFSPHHLV